MRAVLTWSGRALAWGVVLGVGAALVAAVLVPRVAGAEPYAVLTGSMRPDLGPGTLVVVRPVEAAEIGTGDVITYQLESGEPQVVTHRVVAVTTDLRGRTSFVTRGDANTVADSRPVLPAQIRGEYWYAIPFLGRAHVLISPEHRPWVVWAAAGGLLGYAGLAFRRAALARRPRAGLHVRVGHGGAHRA